MQTTAGGTVLTATEATPIVESGDPDFYAPRRSIMTGKFLAGASLSVDLLLALLYEFGLLSVGVTAALTAVFMLVMSVLYLGARPTRMPATLLGLTFSAAPALILATAILAIPLHLGVPISVVSTRLAAVAGWSLALVVLRPLVDRFGSARMPVWRAALLFAPALVVVGMCGYAWGLGRRTMGTAQHLAFLLKSEDNAAWLSHAYSLLRFGHLPRNIVESEYYTYSPVSSLPGVLTQVGLRDRPRSHSMSVHLAVDVTLANQLMSIAAAAAVLGAALVAALLLLEGEERPPSLGIPLLSIAVTGVGASVVAGTPLLLAGHLSLAWADVSLILTVLLAVLALRAPNWRRFVAPCLATCLATYAAAGSWAYIVATPIIFAVLLVTLRKSGLREGSKTPIGDGRRVICLSVGVIVAGVASALPQFAGALKDVGVTKLSGALGGVTPIEPTTLAGAALVGLGVAYVAYRWGDSLSLVITLMMAAASGSAMLVFLTNILPSNTPTYALSKTLYVLLALSPLAVVALLAQASRSHHRRVLVVGSLVLASLITTSPTFGSVVKWPNAVAEPEVGSAQRLLKLLGGASDQHRVVCRPSPYLEAINNYLCNRWTAALSPVQGDGQFRADVLSEGGSAPKAWAKAEANGFLRGATVADAAQIMSGQCVPPTSLAAGVSPARYPRLQVTARSFEPVHPLRLLGHVDAVRQCGKHVVVAGWAPFTNETETLDVWAGGPVDVVRASRRERPDVMARLGNTGLVSPGYILVLKMKPAQAEKVCVSMNGRQGSILGGSRSAGCS